MLSLAPRASLDDCLATVAAGGACHQVLWTCTRHQIAHGLSYAIRDEQGRALAIGGFWPWPDALETWTAFAPPARRRMREVVHLARLTLREVGQSDDRPVIAVARSHAGARIACLLGFQPAGDGIFVWRPQ